MRTSEGATDISMLKILIVDDDPALADVLAAFLGTCGFQTDYATDGATAVQRARDTQPDLIIMDLMLPRLSGGEAAAALKRDPSTSAIPILAISGLDDPEPLVDILAIDALLRKPFDLDELERRVAALLRSRST